MQVNGQRVVVKVQRPGLKELFDIDLKNVRVLAQWLQKASGQCGGCRVAVGMIGWRSVCEGWVGCRVQ